MLVTPAWRRGFTLLELLVVLAIVALASAPAVPRVAGWLEAAEQRGWRADLRAQLARYPLQAFLRGEALEIDAKRLRLDLGDRWPEAAVVRLDQPLRYAANGAAAEGRLTLSLGAWQSEWRVLPLTGEVEELAP
jgi:prepilin-type N-terminal cleavage/methylation domain-containing protein